MVAHAFNPSTQEAEAGGSLSSRPAWSTEWMPGQSGLLLRETLSQDTTKKIFFKILKQLGLQISMCKPHENRGVSLSVQRKETHACWGAFF